MITKSSEKQKAVQLRKQGKSYSEIMEMVPIAKSTLSEWLRDVGLAKAQKQRLTEKKLASAKRGGLARKMQRVEGSNAIFSQARLDVGSLTKRDIFLIGVALYWAEGSKQKEHNVSNPLVFGNSDPNMIKFFLNWLAELGVPKSEFIYELYIHKTGNIGKSVEFWADVVNQPISVFDQRVYFKQGNPKTIRKNSGESYNGLLRVKVKKSTNLNRKVSGWIQGIVKN